MNEEWEKLDLLSEKFWRYMYSFEIAGNSSSTDKFTELNNHVFASEIEYKIFSLLDGEWRVYNNRDEIITINVELSTYYSTILDEVLVDKDKGKVVIYFQAVSTHLHSLLSEKWVYEVICTNTVKNNKITAVKFMFDTFSVLKKTGQASFKSKSNKQIRTYLQSLVQSGIIEKEYLKME